jgi:hypothetical protein
MLQESGALALDDSVVQQDPNQLDKFRNPFAIGQYVNHPPPGQEPNLMSYQWSFSSDPDQPEYIPPELRSLIPHEIQRSHSRLAFWEGDWPGSRPWRRWWRRWRARNNKNNTTSTTAAAAADDDDDESSRTTAEIPSVLLVATKFIPAGHELFLNYRYNPRHPYPDWYHQPDPAEAERRWGKVSWWR